MWRLSNHIGQGSFGDQSFSTSLNFEAPKFIAGETDAYDVTGTENPEFKANTKFFTSAWKFKSVTDAAQPGLSITVSADDGQGSRQTWVTMKDNGVDGIDISFYDAVPYAGSGGDGDIDWRFTILKTGLSYDEWHRVEMSIEYVDGNNAQECRVGTSEGLLSNDIVKIYVDGVLVNPHALTTWEWYFKNTNEGAPAQWQRVRASTRLLFRSSSGAAGLQGNGFYFDDVEVSALAPPPAKAGKKGKKSSLQPASAMSSSYQSGTVLAAVAGVVVVVVAGIMISVRRRHSAVVAVEEIVEFDASEIKLVEVAI
jgi:hypothetical protein